MRLHLTIAYDGTRFAGWQRQRNGLSVQQVVEEALAQVVGAPIRVVSSGRTDAGVHALGMAAHFDSPRELPLRAFREGVNRLLPDDVAVQRVRQVDDAFHARFSATGKWYRYTLHRGAVRSPLWRLRSWHLHPPLDLQLLQTAADQLVGEHDFAAFRVSGCDAATTVRRIDRLLVRCDAELVHIDVVGSGFLRYMVRRLVGTLVEVATGRRPLESLQQLLAEPGRHQAGATAPAHGLCLMAVNYPEEDRDFWENFP